jgi:hypothetical protein
VKPTVDGKVILKVRSMQFNRMLEYNIINCDNS